MSEQKKFEAMPAVPGFRGIPYMNDFQSVKQCQASVAGSGTPRRALRENCAAAELYREILELNGGGGHALARRKVDRTVQPHAVDIND
jgi:hypothetical protein